MRESREREQVSEMKRAIQIVCVVAVVAALGSAASAVNIKTVRVGNPGNVGEQSRLADYGDATYYGGVNYDYRIGKYEVTAGQYCEFLNAVAATDTYKLYDPGMVDNPKGCQIQWSGSWGSRTYSVASDWANRPVNYVSWGDAARFANWLHNGQPTGMQNDSTTEDGAYDLNGATSHWPLMAIGREADWKWAIPTEDEWYKAAYHKNDGVTGNYFDYPTGSDSMPSDDLIDPDPGNNATFYDDGDTIGDPYWRTEVGAHENSESLYGTFDQGGNVFEWNETPLGHGGGYRGRRGGSHDTGSPHYYSGDLSASFQGYQPPTYEIFTMGFRVAEVPEPTTLTLLTLGGLAVIRRRRRK